MVVLFFIFRFENICVFRGTEAAVFIAGLRIKSMSIHSSEDPLQAFRSLTSNLILVCIKKLETITAMILVCVRTQQRSTKIHK